MARTNLPVSALAANSSIADPAGTAADAANGMNITGAPLEEIMLRVVNAGAGSTNVTVRAGVYPPALSEGKGDLVVAVANGTTKWIGPFTSAQFAQKDGSLNVDFSVATSVTVTAFQKDHKAA